MNTNNGNQSNVIEVSYTFGDIFHTVLQSWRTNIIRIALILLSISVVLLFTPVFLGILNSLDESFDALPWKTLIGLSGVLLFCFFVLCPFVSYVYADHRGTLGPNRFSFDDRGVRAEGPKGQILVYWSAMNGVVTTENRLFLFIKPALAFVLPRRAFPDRTNFEAFSAEAMAHWTAAKKETH